MTNEIIEIIKSIKPEDIAMRFQNGINDNHIHTYKYLRFRINRASRISKVRFHNRKKRRLKNNI